MKCGYFCHDWSCFSSWTEWDCTRTNVACEWQRQLKSRIRSTNQIRCGSKMLSNLRIRLRRTSTQPIFTDVCSNDVYKRPGRLIPLTKKWHRVSGFSQIFYSGYVATSGEWARDEVLPFYGYRERTCGMPQVSNPDECIAAMDKTAWGWLGLLCFALIHTTSCSIRSVHSCKRRL